MDPTQIHSSNCAGDEVLWLCGRHTCSTSSQVSRSM